MDGDIDCWVDANIHSVEVTAGVAALHLIVRLVTGFGNDDTVTRALQTRTFYTTTERPTERWSRGLFVPRPVPGSSSRSAINVPDHAPSS